MNRTYLTPSFISSNFTIGAGSSQQTSIVIGDRDRCVLGISVTGANALSSTDVEVDPLGDGNFFLYTTLGSVLAGQTATFEDESVTYLAMRLTFKSTLGTTILVRMRAK